MLRSGVPRRSTRRRSHPSGSHTYDVMSHFPATRVDGGEGGITQRILRFALRAAVAFAPAFRAAPGGAGRTLRVLMLNNLPFSATHKMAERVAALAHPRPLVPDAVYLLHPWSRALRDVQGRTSVAGGRMPGATGISTSRQLLPALPYLRHPCRRLYVRITRRILRLAPSGPPSLRSGVRIRSRRISSHPRVLMPVL